MTPFPAPKRRTRAGGKRSYRTIVDAARLATVEGLDGPSIGRLAQEIGMSKGGLYAIAGGFPLVYQDD